MRKKSAPRTWVVFASALLLPATFLLLLLAGETPATAGGPLVVGGTFGQEGLPFRWDTSLGEVGYRTDGGSLGVLTNKKANAWVREMFQVWEDVPTAKIGFTRQGPIQGIADGDVSTVNEFDKVVGACENATQSPIIYDANGSLFNSLFGPGSGVLGFAGPCSVGAEGDILAALVAMNGAFRDKKRSNGELTKNEFKAVFIHEFGHFFGLDHAQINVNCLEGDSGGCFSGSDDAFGLPTMFPILIGGLEETPGVYPARTLAVDDVAWVSRFYPEASFGGSYGTISGTIFFSDGVTAAQGVNVIARRFNDPATPDHESRRQAVSTVSGYLFTGNPGQSVTATYLPCSPASACPGGFFDNNSGGSPFGSRDPQLIGTFDIPVPPGAYTVEVEWVAFAGGSSVGPLDPPLYFWPRAKDFWDPGESNADSSIERGLIAVGAGETVTGINIILNGTPPRFDPWESAYLGGWHGLFNWIAGKVSGGAGALV